MKKVLDELKRVRAEAGAYRAFWDSLAASGGPVPRLRRTAKKIAEVTLWSSRNTPPPTASARDYVAKMPEGQDEIYITSASREIVEASPHVEALRKRKLDVLLFIEPVDEWVAQGLNEFNGKKLRAIHKGDFTPPKVKTPEGKTAADGPGAAGEEAGAGSARRPPAGALPGAGSKGAALQPASRTAPASSCPMRATWGRTWSIVHAPGRKVTVQKPILEVNPKTRWFRRSLIFWRCGRPAMRWRRTATCCLGDGLPCARVGAAAGAAGDARARAHPATSPRSAAAA